MPQFHETILGRRFFEGQLPKLIEKLDTLANELKRRNDLKEQELEGSNHSKTAHLTSRFEDELALADFIKIQVLNELLNDN